MNPVGCWPPEHHHPVGTSIQKPPAWSAAPEATLGAPTRHHPGNHPPQRSTTSRFALAVDGNATVVTITERAITTYHPQVVPFVWVAGALHDDLDIGDVVVATRIYALPRR